MLLHPRWFNRIGKPYEVWCLDIYEDFPENSIVPLSSVVSVLLTSVHKLDEESVLVTELHIICMHYYVQ